MKRVTLAAVAVLLAAAVFTALGSAMPGGTGPHRRTVGQAEEACEKPSCPPYRAR